ncbi:MAG: alpha/beta fold hydrolase [Akkermansiaceae bacterium]|nr:alpha/beta fold hydrolase [Akkermansiaceae bacterium]NNM30488.1 alpha/beta fold hydrolase [Akkermansiaceae bacterium]
MDWGRLLWGRPSWLRPVRSLAMVYLGVTAVVFLAGNQLIFQPPAAGYRPDSEPFVVLDGDRKLACFFLPPAREDAPLLLWSHGNAEDIGSLQPLLERLHARGFGILAYDYPGYGASEGSPAERACYEAIDRAWNFATVEKGLSPERILVLGQSVGSGPATWLAERRETGGLILLSPFLSAYRTLTRIPLFPGDKFPNAARIRSVDEPLLVAHGTRDGVVPFEQGRRIHDLHPGPKHFLAIEGAGHNDIWSRGWPELVEGLEAIARGEL